MSSPPSHTNLRRRAMSSPPAPPDAGNPESQLIFTDEILGEIFLRLDSAADLARASAACTAFLRVVRFLRRNRSLYRQPVVGFLDCSGGPTPLHSLSLYHAEPPHRAAAAARALAEGVDFTCPFLPDPGSWKVHDATGGRLLLCSDSTELVVCDPLQRRYVRIPPVPYLDLMPVIFKAGAYYHFPSFFAPTGEQEEGSSFRVIRMIYSYNQMKVTAFVFSSVNDQWRKVAIDGWESIGATDQWWKVAIDEWESIGDIKDVLTSCRYHPNRSLLRRAAGLFSEVLMLDTNKMEFTVVRTPLVRNGRQHAIFEAGEGRLGFLTIRDGMLDICCKAWQDNGVSVEEWQHEKIIPIPLPDSGRYSISFYGAGDGYLLLRAMPRDSAQLEQFPGIHYFTVQLKTLLVERLCLLNKPISHAHLYANFLPPLSLPSV